METLLRLSGLLSADDGGKTDLGTLEKRLADRSLENGASTAKSAENLAAAQSMPPQPTMSQYTPHGESQSTPPTTDTSPEPQKNPENEVEALSDMMCSLVTNNCGETRYIGMLFFWVML